MSISKKEKKKAQLKKNRHHQEIFNIVRLRRQEEERVRKLDDQRKPKPKPKQAEEDAETAVWSEKVAKIRNRLDGKQRLSKERWNRFAGTADSGGRGL